MQGTSNILECRGLTKQYGKNGPFALKDIHLALPRGRIVGLLGPNGSGKTTLLKHAAGLLTPTAGAVKVDGKTAGLVTKPLVSFLPDKDFLPNWMKARDLIAYFADFFPDFDRVKALEMLGRLGLLETMRLKSMSKGMREKMQLILGMARNCPLYLLDEPIGGVDPAARDYILETIIGNYRENATVVISTHLIADIEKVLDDAVLINRGTLAMHIQVEEFREREGKSIDTLFREVYRC